MLFNPQSWLPWRCERCAEAVGVRASPTLCHSYRWTRPGERKRMRRVRERERVGNLRLVSFCKETVRSEDF
ncbi:hypothetical protein E2C01_086067 [Portunus trituberculatus]|uniref:Uncharacterized protein n=1 Tax=Portunus trituberculatus TaxID=210409 RepID=A0A5B7JFC2_PORTR|nr:hypothetical protein [Portunus trituberculatus]